MKRKYVEFLLCILLGPFGAHHFYNRDFKKGILYFFTLGLFFIGWFYDVFQLGLEALSGGYESDESRNYELRNEIDNSFPPFLHGKAKGSPYTINISGTYYADKRALSRVRVRDNVSVIPFPSEYDAFGVRVFNENGKPLGWIPKDLHLKETIFNGINSGHIVLAKVLSVRKYNNNTYVAIIVMMYV